MWTERRQKRKFVCWIAQFFNLRDSSTFFFFQKKKRKGNTRRAFATWFANNARRTEGLFGEGKGKEWGISLTGTVIHLMSALSAFTEAMQWECRLEPPWSLHWILKHLAVTSAPQRQTHYQSLFLEGLLWIEPSIKTARSCPFISELLCLTHELYS